MIYNTKKQCRLINIKFLLLVTVVLKFLELQESPLLYHQKYFERDQHFCPACFRTQIEQCQEFFQRIDLASLTTFHNIFNMLANRERRAATQMLQWRSDKVNKKQRMIAKYFVRNDEQLKIIKKQFNCTVLKDMFFAKERLDGFQYCPTDKWPIRFVDYFRQLQQKERQQKKAKEKLTAIDFVNNSDVAHSELPIWLYMLLNVQPLLLPYLHMLNFPVPATYANCGFTLFQEYAGKTFNHFYNANFRIKLKIAKQLLEAALRFSYGFANFRLYITDLNADNIAYNVELDKLYIIDLDTVLIVDAASNSTSSTTANILIHRHAYIDCYDCFAYSSQDICAHQLSDINLFAACQLLREDLKMDRSKGFLYPIPNEIVQNYPQLVQLLDVCVDCPAAKCANRFATTRNLIEIIENILLENL